MPTLIAAPSIITAAGHPPKKIEEFIGRVNSKTDARSVARMTSPVGWVEPGQTPEFDEFSVVLRGVLRVESKTGTLDVAAGSAIIMHKALPARNRTRHVWYNWSQWAKAQGPHRRRSSELKRNRGAKSPSDRVKTPDPPPPNGRTRFGRAGAVMPRSNAALA